KTTKTAAPPSGVTARCVSRRISRSFDSRALISRGTKLSAAFGFIPLLSQMSTREQSAQLRNSGLTIAVLAITSAPLLAQSAFPRADLFGGYSWVSLDSGSSRHNLNGWTGQASVNLNSW